MGTVGKGRPKDRPRKQPKKPPSPDLARRNSVRIKVGPQFVGVTIIRACGHVMSHSLPVGSDLTVDIGFVIGVRNEQPTLIEDCVLCDQGMRAVPAKAEPDQEG